MTAYQEPHLKERWRKEAIEQGLFDFLCPWKGPHITPQQAAKSLGRSETFVLGEIDAGRLEVFAPLGREVTRYTITLRSLKLLVAAMANRAPDDWERDLLGLIEGIRDTAQLGRIIAAATRRRASL